MLRKDLNSIVPEWLLAMGAATVLLLGPAMEAPAQDQPEDAEPVVEATVTYWPVKIELMALRWAATSGVEELIGNGPTSLVPVATSPTTRILSPYFSRASRSPCCFYYYC